MGSPPLPPSSKLRLMCSYGGHIVPRPNDKTLIYAGGDTRIVAVDRHTTAAAFSVLHAHLSRFLFNNHPFHLKYQLPSEDLDSLISVVTDEDLTNMLDENDRLTPPTRIRLFLFPVKPESPVSTLLDHKSESWFSDALKHTRIMQSADSGLLTALQPESETPVDAGFKLGAESFVLETSSSFGSSGSSFSVSNSPPVGVVSCEDKGGLNLLERKIRLPSSASIESENSAGGASSSPRAGMFQEPLIQISPEAPSFLPKSQSTVSDPSIGIPTQNTVHLLGYPLPQQPDGKQQQQETQLIQGGVHYLPQYTTTPMPMSPYYPVYQPLHQQTISCPPNQPYPIYLVPVRPTQYHNMPMQCNIIDTNNTSSASRPPLHPQTATIPPNIAHKEIFGAQAVAESATNVYRNIPACASPVIVPSNQCQLVTGIPEPLILSKPVTPDSVPSATQSNDFDDDIAYSQIYKTQPSAPVSTDQYQTIKNGIALMLSESSVQVQPNH